MGVSFHDWFSGCGYQFYHCLDRYGNFGHCHVFVVTFEHELYDAVDNLNASDPEYFKAVKILDEAAYRNDCFIGFNKDPIEALRKCLEKIKIFHSQLG